MVNGSSTATPLPAAHAPQLSKCISGDSTAGNLASSPSAILPGHGVNYSFRGGSSHIQQTFSLSRSGSKVIPKSVGVISNLIFCYFPHICYSFISHFIHLFQTDFVFFL